MLFCLSLWVVSFLMLYMLVTDRICWNKKMTGGASIFYWVSSDVIYASNIRNAE